MTSVALINKKSFYNARYYQRKKACEQYVSDHAIFNNEFSFIAEYKCQNYYIIERLDYIIINGRMRMVCKKEIYCGLRKP